MVCANTTDCPNGTCVDGLCITGGPGDASVDVRVTPDGGVDAASDAGPDSISLDSGPDVPTDVGVDSGLDASVDPACVPLPLQASLEETADYRIVRGIHTYIDFGDGLPRECGRNSGSDFSLPFDFPFWGEAIPSGTVGRVDGYGAIHFGDPGAFPARTRELGGAPGPGVIAAFWGDDAASTCVNSSTDQLEIWWVHGEDSLSVVKATLLPTGIIETTIYVDRGPGVGPLPIPGTLGLESRDGRSVSQPCSPSCGDAEIFPGATTRYIPVAQPMGPLVVPTCFEGPLTRRHRDEPPRFVGFTNLGDSVGTLPLGLVWSSSAGDFGRDPVAFGNFDEYWLTSGVSDVAVGATVLGLTLPYEGYAAFANTGTTHVVVSGNPDAYYVGTMEIEPYEGAVVSAPLEEHVASAGALFDVMLVGDPSAERWSSRNSGTWNPEWLTLQEDGRLYGTPPEAGVYGVSVAVHRSGMEPANHDVRITVE